LEITHDAIDTFFSDFANCEVDARDYSELLEIAQIVISGFYIEVLEIDDGAHYVLAIAPHADAAWNIRDSASPLIEVEATWYRFETLHAAKEALARFLSAAI
jgi:hypothetical protein